MPVFSKRSGRILYLRLYQYYVSGGDSGEVGLINSFVDPGLVEKITRKKLTVEIKETKPDK